MRTLVFLALLVVSVSAQDVAFADGGTARLNVPLVEEFLYAVLHCFVRLSSSLPASEWI